MEKSHRTNLTYSEILANLIFALKFWNEKLLLILYIRFHQDEKIVLK
jgi:hypothetical protein